MGRSPCCSKEGLNRGAWTAMEDKILIEYIKIHGEGKWRNLPKRAGLKRCGKSCRLRWLNYLRPDIKRGNISTDEEDLIIRLHNLLGNRWSLIAGRLPGRTDNEIKNYWNTNIGKRIQIQASPNNQNNHDVNNAKTTCRIQSPKPSQTTLEYQPNVFRTKATRCTKVVLFPPDQLNKEALTISTDSKPVDVGDTVVPTVLDQDHDHQVDGSDQRSIPILDDDHENFLSDFLSLDCLQHFSDCFDAEENGHTINGNNLVNSSNNNNFGDVIEPQSSHSPPSDLDHCDNHHREANFLFSQDMASLSDPELDWLFQE